MAVLAALVAAPAESNQQHEESKDHTLRVNRSLDHYTLELSREDGERRLVDLAKSEKVEEAWVFVKYKDGKEKWNKCNKNLLSSCCNLPLLLTIMFFKILVLVLHF